MSNRLEWLHSSFHLWTLPSLIPSRNVESGLSVSETIPRSRWLLGDDSVVSAQVRDKQRFQSG